MIFPSLSFGEHLLHGRPRYLFVPLHFGHVTSGTIYRYSPGLTFDMLPVFLVLYLRNYTMSDLCKARKPARDRTEDARVKGPPLIPLSYWLSAF